MRLHVEMQLSIIEMHVWKVHLKYQSSCLLLMIWEDAVLSKLLTYIFETIPNLSWNSVKLFVYIVVGSGCVYVIANVSPTA